MSTQEEKGTWVAVDGFAVGSPQKGDSVVVQVYPGDPDHPFEPWVQSAEILEVGRHFSSSGKSGYYCRIDVDAPDGGHTRVPRNQSPPAHQAKCTPMEAR